MKEYEVIDKEGKKEIHQFDVFHSEGGGDIPLYRVIGEDGKIKSKAISKELNNEGKIKQLMKDGAKEKIKAKDLV